MIYVWVIAIIAIYAFIYYTDANRKIDKMFPGPFRVPVFGNALKLIRTPKSLTQFVLKLPKKYYHKTMRFWFLHKPYILVSDYKVAKMILSNPSFVDKIDEYDYFEPWLGEKFIFTATQVPWKRHRKAILPAFHSNILINHLEVFHKNAEILCKKLEKHQGKDAFDIYEYIILYALDNVCDAVGGLSMEAQNNPDLSYVKALKGISKVIYYRLVLLWLRSDTIFNMTSLSSLQKKYLRILHEFSNGIIQERKNQLKQSEANQDLNLKRKKGFLDSLIENGQAVGWTDIEIRQAVDFLVFAGHDTVASSIGFLLYALAEHQDVQDKVCEELERIFQNSNRGPTYDDLQNMRYAEQVIKETLRCYPVATILGRKLSDDLVINEKQYIPKHMTVWIHMDGIHKDPNVWPNPDKFDPKRFSPEVSQSRDPYTFLAFSAGPRNCAGIKFAMFEMKITLHSILRKYKLSLSDNPEDKMSLRLNFINTSANGIRIKIESRNT